MSAKKLFWLLFLLNLFNYIDRQALFSVFPLIQADLHVTDFQLGALASAFMLAYMCYAPIVGFFADRTARHKWIAASAFVWSMATLACGWAKNYAGLLGARCFIGAGEAGFTTIAQPFLAEHSPAHKRATVLACFGLALPAGSALGYLLGGLAGQHWGWRAAFMLAGVPGIFLALAAWFCLQDPARKNQTAAGRPGRKEYGTLFKNKPFLLICLAHAMVTFVQGGLSAWMPTYFHRYLALDVADAAAAFGLMVVLCGAAGTYLGGKAADKLSAKNANAYFITIGAGLLLVPPCAWAALHTASAATALGWMSAAVLCIFLPMGPIAAALVELTDEKIRSMAFAVNIFIIHALGDAVSPILIGRASDRWGLQTAVLLCCLTLLPGILFTWLAARYKRPNGSPVP